MDAREQFFRAFAAAAVAAGAEVRRVPAPLYTRYCLGERERRRYLRRQRRLST